MSKETKKPSKMLDMDSIPDEELTNYMTPKMIKYCQMALLTSSLTQEDIAKRLGVSKSDVAKWEKNQFVNRFMNVHKRKLVDEEMLQKMRQQQQALLDRSFLEYQSRFDAFDETTYNSIADPILKSAYVKRFAQNAEFKDLARSLIDLTKQNESLLPKNLESQSQVSIRQLVVKQRQKYESARAERQELEKLIQRGDVARTSNPMIDLFLYAGKEESEYEQEQTRQILKDAATETENEVSIREILITHNTRQGSDDE
jgi:transcriptional regulator with XRE-family HTH domain